MTTPSGSCKHPGQPFGPNNPPRLRKPGESVEDYRVAMGWDQPKQGRPHCGASVTVEEAAHARVQTWPEQLADVRLKMLSAFRAGAAFERSCEAPHTPAPRTWDDFPGATKPFTPPSETSSETAAKLREQAESRPTLDPAAIWQWLVDVRDDVSHEQSVRNAAALLLAETNLTRGVPGTFTCCEGCTTRPVCQRQAKRIDFEVAPGVAPSHSSASEHGETWEQETFCDRNCCWSGHHPDCVRHTPPAAPGVTAAPAPRPHCRDCADFAQDGICPNSGKPCAPGVNASGEGRPSWRCDEAIHERPRCEHQCPVCEGDENDIEAERNAGVPEGGKP